MTYTYENLIVRCAITFNKLLALTYTDIPNDHGKLFIKGVVETDVVDIMRALSNTWSK